MAMAGWMLRQQNKVADKPLLTERTQRSNTSKESKL